MQTTIKPLAHSSDIGTALSSLSPAGPPDAAALHALGLSAMYEKNFELAAGLFGQAIQVAGPVATYCESLARALYGAGKFRQSAACYEQAILGNPEEVRLYFALSRILIQDNRAAEAVTVLKRAIALRPDISEAWALFGGALNVSGHSEQAAQALEQAIQLDPDKASFHYDLGLVLGQLGDLEKSEAAYRRALQITPWFPEALNNLGNLLRRGNRSEDAADCLRRALRYQPDYTDARYNLGLAFQSLDRLEEAEAAYRRVLKVAPAHHAASNNYGNVLVGQGKVRDALARYRHAVDLAPDNREYRVNTGIAQLLQGDFAEGWRNYGARAAPSFSGAGLWTGQPLEGRSILLLNEQGLGDTIQFIRYARQLGDWGGRVRALCQEPLVELIRTMPGVERVIAASQDPPSCDLYSPLLSLPAVFGTRAETIPAEIPYLSADPERVRSWGLSLQIPENHLRVGVAWRGGSDHWNDRNRSMDPSLLAGLAGVPAITFISLQKGVREGCKGLPFAALHRDLLDFADTAALMVELDLVISVDTSVAHLAGALGLPTWVMLPFAPDWRWMRGRSDSPWYPGMRLFRQERRGKWGPVIKKVREALAEMAEENNVST